MEQYKNKYLKYKLKLEKQSGGLKKPFNMKCLQTCKMPKWETDQGDCLWQCFKSTLKHGLQIYDDIVYSGRSLEEILTSSGEKEQVLNPWKVQDYNDVSLIDNHLALEDQLIDIYSRIEPNHCMILIINKYNTNNLPDTPVSQWEIIKNSRIRYGWHAVIVGRTDDALVLYDPKWHSIAINKDIINQPYHPDSKYKSDPQYNRDIVHWNEQEFFYKNRLALFIIHDKDLSDISQFYNPTQVRELLRKQTNVRGPPTKPHLSRQPTHISDPNYLPKDIKSKCSDYNTHPHVNDYRDTLCFKNGCFYDKKTGNCVIKKPNCSRFKTKPGQNPYITECFKNGCRYNKRTGRCYKNNKKYRNKYLKYKFKYLTLKSNLEFAVKNSKNFNNGKMKYLNLKKLSGGHSIDDIIINIENKINDNKNNNNSNKQNIKDLEENNNRLRQISSVNKREIENLENELRREGGITPGIFQRLNTNEQSIKNLEKSISSLEEEIKNR